MGGGERRGRSQRRADRKLTRMGVVGSGAMLANVVGVPLGAVAGQVVGWRGPFWALAILAVASMGLIARYVPRDGAGHGAVSIRSELAALRSARLWLTLAACATTTGGVLSAYSYISPLLSGRAGIAAGLVPLVLVGFGVGALAGFLVWRLPRRHAPSCDDHCGACGNDLSVARDLPPRGVRRADRGAGGAPGVLRARRQPGPDLARRPLRGRGTHAGLRSRCLGVQLRNGHRRGDSRPRSRLQPRCHRPGRGRRRHRLSHPHSHDRDRPGPSPPVEITAAWGAISTQSNH